MRRSRPASAFTVALLLLVLVLGVPGTYIAAYSFRPYFVDRDGGFTENARLFDPPEVRYYHSRWESNFFDPLSRIRGAIEGREIQHHYPNSS